MTTVQSIYNMTQIENDWNNIPNHFDCFIIAGGSDFRAYEILRKAEKTHIRIDNVFLFDFDERKKGLSKESNRLYYNYKSLNYKFKIVQCSLKNPSICMKSLNKYGINFSKYKKVSIDISCFTKPYFFLILKHLKAISNFLTLTVFYTEPKSYVFPKGLFNSYQSSFGPLKVLEIPSYTGSDIRGQKSLLVILLGFDGDLSREIDEDVAPIETIIVNGFPGYAPKFKDISLICNDKLINNKGKEVNYSSANNPFEIYNFLDKLKRDYNNFFINIAPLGTKPMALGVCMFAIHNPQVRIVYPVPERYVNVTTDKCWKSWAYKISLV